MKENLKNVSVAHTHLYVPVKTNIFLFPPICCKPVAIFAKLLVFRKEINPQKYTLEKLTLGGKHRRKTVGTAV